MIYRETDPEEWRKKYGFEGRAEACANCGRLFRLNVPIVIKGYAGLEMEEHGCPQNFKAAIFTPTSEEEKNFWKNTMTKTKGG